MQHSPRFIWLLWDPLSSVTLVFLHMSQRTPQPMSLWSLPASPSTSHMTHVLTTKGWRCIWDFVVNTSLISPWLLDPTWHQRTERLNECDFTSSCHSKSIACSYQEIVLVSIASHSVNHPIHYMLRLFRPVRSLFPRMKNVVSSVVCLIYVCSAVNCFETAWIYGHHNLAWDRQCMLNIGTYVIIIPVYQ